jgi:hypothetical protein
MYTGWFHDHTRQIVHLAFHHDFLENAIDQNLNSRSNCMRRAGSAATAWPKSGELMTPM